MGRRLVVGDSRERTAGTNLDLMSAMGAARETQKAQIVSSYSTIQYLKEDCGARSCDIG
jgi:hypothetical protein